MAGHPDDRPAWAERLRSERVVRGWSQAAAVRALRVHFPGGPTGAASLLHAWQRWEAGVDHPDPSYQAALARTFGLVTAALFGPVEVAEPVPGESVGTGELVDRMRAGELDGRTLRALEARVEALCGRYPWAPARQLLPLARGWQDRIIDRLYRELTPDQYRDVLRLAGVLTLLVGCLEWDVGRLADAESSRRDALSLGRESGSSEVLGWAYELQAWFALTQGDYRTVMHAVEAGQAIAAGLPVAAQLAARAAQAWARIADRRPLEVALDQARRLLEAMPVAQLPASPFVVDPARFDLWAMDCYRVLGEDRLAAGHAREVLRNAASVTGGTPLRAAAAELTLAVVAARAGNLTAALQHGKLALNGDRTSLPDLLMLCRELQQVLDRDFYGQLEVAAFAAQVRGLQAELLA